VAALTLLQNGIPVRIIDKDPNPRIGQRGPGIMVSHTYTCRITRDLIGRMIYIATHPRAVQLLEYSRGQRSGETSPYGSFV
jgi:hypothetical protein